MYTCISELTTVSWSSNEMFYTVMYLIEIIYKHNIQEGKAELWYHSEFYLLIFYKSPNYVTSIFSLLYKQFYHWPGT
jgi:hypothetical protein